MGQRSLVFDASALLFSKPILPFVQRNYIIAITELISIETGVSKGVTIIQLEDEDKDLAFNILKMGFGKEQAISYKKRGKMTHAGEAEALAIAKRLKIPVVLHEELPCRWCKAYNITYVKVADLPEKLGLIPIESLISFYEALCKQRSSQKACDKAKELYLKKGTKR